VPNTTISAIRTALIKTITNLAPLSTVDPMGSPAYVHNAAGLAGDATSDVDREFCLDEFQPGLPTVFGMGSEMDYQGELAMRIGHVIGEDGDEEASRSRADSDVAQLRRVLEKVANYPTGVSLIRLISASQQIRSVAEARYLETTLRFTLNYTLAAV
jgi:hypothetical protein